MLNPWWLIISQFNFNFISLCILFLVLLVTFIGSSTSACYWCSIHNAVKDTCDIT